MSWKLGTVLASVAFAAIAVWVRRRYGVERLFGVAVVVWTCLVGAGLLLLSSVFLPRDGLGFGVALFFLLAGVTGGTGALTLAVHRVVESSTIPDPLPETAFGAVAFVGGVLGGLFVALFLIGLGMPRIA